MMKNHVVSLEIAKQLKEAGWKKTTNFYHILPCQSHGMIPWGFIDTKEAAYKWNPEYVFPAPLATEILEELPYNITILKGSIWQVSYPEKTEWKHIKSISLPDALAKMWIYLQTQRGEK